MSAAGLELARLGLRALAGLAPSPVLDARLTRAAHLLPELAPVPGLDSSGWAALLDAATVQETQLFRGPAQLALIEARLPALLAGIQGRPLRLLSAGCATGEEAFSLAAIGVRAAAEHAPGLEVEVLGVDICRPALASAEAGIISPHLGEPLRLVPAGHLPWLADARGQPRLHSRLRRTLRFQRANLLDLPDDLGWFDVILCRNVLIYMDMPARRQVLEGLGARLHPGGMLGLGATDAGPGAPFSAAGHAVFAHG